VIRVRVVRDLPLDEQQAPLTIFPIAIVIWVGRQYLAQGSKLLRGTARDITVCRKILSDEDTVVALVFFFHSFSMYCR
jgi:hypothetical protein